MNGDRLKFLEQGFLDGSLTDQEEAELKALVAEQSEHRLKAYFQWASSDETHDLPDFRQKIGTTNSFNLKRYMKVAAAILVMAMATYLVKPDLFHGSDKYSQVEIDESYQATMETLSAMASFLDNSFKEASEGIDMSKPFENLNELKNDNSK